MKRKKKELSLHQRIHAHLSKHFHRHIHKVLHVTNFVHHQLFHGLELFVILAITISSWSLLFANLTGLNQDLYTNNATETAEHLLSAMQNPTKSLKQWNIISIRTMDMDIEHSFAKWYCTYGAARVSPEFFPFIDEKTQQRTWWGNAVDRCKNASDTWYKIWSVPSQWALIVYDAWGRFGSYGHVGKVLHYDKTLKKIIVRDMARVGRGQMSDRRDDLTTAQVKCYIYNSKTNTPDDTTHTNTDIPAQTNTWATTGITIINTTTTQTTTSPTNSTATTTHNSASTTTSTTTPVVTTTTTTALLQSPINKKLSLTLDDLSDIAEHFITQNNLVFTLISKTPLKLWETATLTLEIKDKNTGEPFSGLLPFSFTILSTNDTLQPSISNIQLINNGSVDVAILAQKTWTATIVISMDGSKIGELTLEAK